MILKIKNRNFYIMIFGDMVLFFAAFSLAHFIRFDFMFTPPIVSRILAILPFVIVVKTVTFFCFGLYQGMWRYSSLNDAWNLLKATVVSSLIVVAFVLFRHRFEGYSRGVYMIDMILTFLLTGCYRLIIRIAYQRGYLVKDFKEHDTPREKPHKKKAKKRIILVGAGDAGEKTFREIRDNPSLGYTVVAFVDDDHRKIGYQIHGVPIRGPVSELPRIAEELDIQEMLVTMPSATGEKRRRVIEYCKKTAIPCKTLPTLGEIIDGKVSIKALRDVNYDDLLGRESATLDQKAIREYLKGKRVLVTGAGGSIGSELCRQIIKYKPKVLIMVDSSESNLYAVQMELEHRLKFRKYVPILANVQYAAVIDLIVRERKPDVVVHAAANKHVPMMEENPWEAVFNNIIGTWNVMEASSKHGVKRFVMVSTDKAVRPTNVMGATKRVCELLMQTYHRQNGIVMMSVRFGNVIGSSGSVVPLFREQIAYGGPVTVTHPEVTRYFMTIPEAAQLVLQAGALGEGGEIFILKMGTPVKIDQMARDLICLSGKEPEKDIEIVYTGLRPGEKLYEELITEGEGIVQTTHEKIMVLRPMENAWNGFENRDNFHNWLIKGIWDLREAAMKHDGKKIRQVLKELVPEYTPRHRMPKD